MVDLRARIEEAGRAVLDLEQPTGGAEVHVARARQERAGQLLRPLLGIQAAHERQIVLANAVDVGWIEGDVAVDPHQLGEAVGQRIGGHVRAALIDGRVTVHAAHVIAGGFELAEAVVALTIDVRLYRHEDDAGRWIQLRRSARPIASLLEGMPILFHVLSDLAGGVRELLLEVALRLHDLGHAVHGHLQLQ